MQERYQEWDETKRYNYRDLVSYNSYNYRYLNKDQQSSEGVPPNVETFQLDVEGESRTVRSWTILDYLFIGDGLLNSDIKAVRGIYNYATSPAPTGQAYSQFRFDVSFWRQAFETTTGINDSFRPIGNNWVNESDPTIYWQFRHKARKHIPKCFLYYW
jgi:hypothetical protein